MTTKYFVLIGTDDGGASPLFDYDLENEGAIKMKLFDSLEQVDKVMESVHTTWGYEVYEWVC